MYYTVYFQYENKVMVQSVNKLLYLKRFLIVSCEEVIPVGYD